MDLTAFTDPAGQIVSSPKGYSAFLPEDLPRSVSLSSELAYLLSNADRALGELAGVARTVENPELLVAPLSQREAVLSSKIEGTQASLSDLALFEAAGESAPGVHSDVLEVRNYRTAMNYGIERLDSLPLSLRLVRELHARLLHGVRGQEMTPGEFRTSQNWIGPAGCTLNEATYVPPPPDLLIDCLSDWELFLHEELHLPLIIQCALMHYQFEAIHPFLDGNGRVGRLMIVLFLCDAGHLPAPVLYLSPFFERHRQAYYDLLRGVSEKSRWEDWFTFFVRAVIAQCKDASVRTGRMTLLRESYRRRLLDKRAPPLAHSLLDDLFVNPGTTAARAASRLNMSVMSAARAIEVLEESGIIEEITGRHRDRIYLARGLVDAINEESGVED